VLTGIAILGLVIPASQNSLHAQSLTSTGSLSGTISDPTGAVIPRAAVTVSSTASGISRQFTTDSGGHFTFALLPAGTYTLTVEAQGFNTAKQSGISLRVGDSVTDNLTLKVANASEQVTVTSVAPLLQTESANVSTEVTQRQVQDLPLNLRNVTGLVLLNSSVNNQTQQQVLASGGAEDTADQDMSFLSFGGGFFGTTAFMLDGGWNVSEGWGGTIYVPSADDVQEFKVQSNSFSAQYGWSTGNVVNVITKSGTSEYHADIYDFMRNSALDANTFFNNRNHIKKVPDHRQQYGAAGGGPLYIPGIYKQRNKTFFFANYEALRLHSAGVDNEIMPTSNQLAGNFSAQLGASQIGADALCRPIYAGQIYNPFTTRTVTATCGPHAGQTVTIRDPYPGNTIPSSGVGAIDARAKVFATGNYWPGAQNPGSQFNFNVSASQPTDSNEYGIRIDHNINQATRIYGRWSQKYETKSGTPAYYGANNIAGPEVSNPNNRYSIALGGSRVFTPTFVVNANTTFVRWVEGNHTQSFGFKSSTIGLPAQIDAISPQFPQINVTNYAPLGARAGFGEFRSPNNTGSFSVDLSKIAGKNSLTFGYMGVILQNNGGRISPTVFNFSNTMTDGPDPTLPTTSGDGFASFMAGAGTSGYTGFNAFGANTRYFHGEYLQDDWKAAKNLTINLGIRYEVQTPLRERYNHQANFDFHALNPVSAIVGKPYYGQIVYNSSANRNLYNQNWSDIAPRAGFSYSPTNKLVIRGGYGFYYAVNMMGSGPNPGYSQRTNWSPTLDGQTPTESLAQAFSTGILPVTGNALAGMTNVGQGGGGINPGRPDPKVRQFMFGVQYAVTPDDMLDVAYVGNRGSRMTLGSMNYGQLDPKYLSMGTALNTPVPNPFYGKVSGSTCLNSPTVQQAQLLLPYPEYCGTVGASQETIGNSNYNALQVNFTHREAKGLTFMASYTYAKFLDDVGGAEEWGSINSGGGSIRNYYNLRGDWSVDSTDIPQSVVLNYVYALPVGRGKKFGGSMNAAEDAVVGGWQVSGISNFKAGFPLSISNGGANSNSVWGGNQHATVASGADFKSGSCANGQKVGTDVCWFNTSAFSQTPAYQFGNAPRYFSRLRAPGYNDTDLAIQKWFSVGDQLRIQFRAEMFNFVNHANFTSPNAGIGNTNFGLVTNTMGARQVQLALKIYR
jgi:hypothetical protein